MWEVIEYEFKVDGGRASLHDLILSEYQANGVSRAGSLMHSINSHYTISKGFLSEFYIDWDWGNVIEDKQREWFSSFSHLRYRVSASAVDNSGVSQLGGFLLNDDLSPGCGIAPDSYLFYSRNPIPSCKAATMEEVELPPGLYQASHRKLIIGEGYEGSYRTVNLDGPDPSSGTWGDEIFTNEPILLDLFRSGVAAPCLISFRGMITHRVKSFPFAEFITEDNNNISARYDEVGIALSNNFIDALVSSWRPSQVVAPGRAYLWSSWFFHPNIGVHPDQEKFQMLREKADKAFGI